MSYRPDNINPGEYGHGNKWGIAGNNITIRGADITEGVPSQKPSKNLAQASLKSLRLFRKACRLMPFLLRAFEIQWRLTPTQAMLNLGNYFRRNSHLRDPVQIDFSVNEGYIKLMEAEQHHTYSTYLFQYISPTNASPGDRGYSFLEEKRFKGKTSFLKGFYKGNKPDY